MRQQPGESFKSRLDSVVMDLIVMIPLVLYILGGYVLPSATQDARL